VKKDHQVGWVEWAFLPDLAGEPIKAKVDTGAKTSALHAENIRVKKLKNGRRQVSFTVFTSKTKKKGLRVTAPLLGSKVVKSSIGVATIRPVIRTTLKLGEHLQKVEVTLVNRQPMEYLMLVGRESLKGFAVYPDQKFLLGKKKP
tara:strand:+ start:1069 stop:1503 length:435 start_codon:yes stop_codon:yes gene_type:complete